MLVKTIMNAFNGADALEAERMQKSYMILDELGVATERSYGIIEKGGPGARGVLAFHLANRLKMRPEDSDGLINFDPVHYTSTVHGEIAFEKNISYLRRLGFVPDVEGINVHNDGINHYNIYSGSRRLVGQMASNFFANDVPYHTPHGGFITLEGYYHFLRIIDWMNHMESVRNPGHRPTPANDMRLVRASQHYRDIERLRKQTGPDAIRWGRELKKKLYGGTTYKVAAFSPASENNFILALITKLSTLYIGNAMLGNVMAAIHFSGVPFTHYYVVDGRTHNPPHADWLPSILVKIVEQIDPNADSFCPMQVADVLGLAQ
ncbi:MAG: hypothetical protein ACRDBQ_18185 [Shewanella sp.]